MRCYAAILLLVSAAVALTNPRWSLAADGEPLDRHVSPHCVQQTVGVGDARWTAGFWGDRFALLQDMILPEMRAALQDEENGANLDNFRVAAGERPGQHRGTGGSD